MTAGVNQRDPPCSIVFKVDPAPVDPDIPWYLVRMYLQLPASFSGHPVIPAPHRLDGHRKTVL